MAELTPPDLTILDRAALPGFLTAWLGYGLAIHALSEAAASRQA